MSSELKREAKVWEIPKETRLAVRGYLLQALIVWAAYVGAVLVAAAFLSLVSCTPGARERALQTTLSGVNTSRDAFIQFDREFQGSIVEHAGTLEDGQDALHAYRERRERAVHAFSVAYAAIAAAAVDIKPESMIEAAMALRELRDAVRALMEGEGR